MNNFDLKKTMFDGCLKRIGGSARQLMLLMFIINKYLTIKAMTPD